LISTIDQPFKNGSATINSITRYIHPDHLGSTNVLTNASGTPVQTLDYFPYGGIRVNSSTSTANSARKYIGQFYDQNSGMDYLNARYHSSDRGQFISEEPIFQSLGDAKQINQLSGQDQQTYLRDPQRLNSYAYGRDNPISLKDTTGRQADPISLTIEGTAPVWIPSFTAWAGPMIVGAESFIATKLLPRSSNGDKYGPFPGPGLDYQTAQLVSQNSYRVDPPEPNGNWKGIGGTIVGSSIVLKWINDKANEGSGSVDGPSNSDWIYAIYQYTRGKNGAQNNSPKTAPVSQTTRSSTNMVPNAIYGSPGSRYTDFVTPDAHSACGALCRR
jgi:RHS repeat-associated protein